MFNKLLIKTLEALSSFQDLSEYHGFLNISNLCLQPNNMPSQGLNLLTFVEALINGFSVILWDHEAHKYWEVIESKLRSTNVKSIPKSN